MTLLFAYGLGIPLAAMFCFPLGMGLPGMWFGIAIANGLLVLAISKVISGAAWQDIATSTNQLKRRKQEIAGLLSEKVTAGYKEGYGDSSSEPEKD